MKVLVKRTSKYELSLDADGMTLDGQHFEDITDVMADDTADADEKTRTIICSFEGDFGTPSSDSFSVFVLDDEGQLIFTGYMSSYA